MSGPIPQEDWVRVRRESGANLDHVIDSVGLPNVLLGYQGRTVALLETTAVRVLFIEKSRRIGETWALASYAVLRAGRAKEAGGMDAMYISYSQEMTREFIDACAMWARAFAQAAIAQEEFLFEDTDPADPEETRQIKAFRIQFASGFEILALSSAPRTLRGKQGLVIIDEAAFVDSLKELLKAALANLMWGGQVVVCSTHNGADNEFNVQIQDILGGRSKYSHLQIDFDQALLEGLYERICLVTGQEWSPEGEAQWRQDIIDFYGDAADEELFCIPSMGSGAWLTTPLIEARMTLEPAEAPVIRIDLPLDFLHRPDLERRHLMAPHLDAIKAALDELDENRQHAFGYDPARKADPAVMTLLAIDKVLRRRSALTVELRNVPFQEQKEIATLMLKKSPRLCGAAIDATGVGMNLAEDLGRIFGLRTDDTPGGLVWSVTLSQKWYNENFPPLKTAFEDDNIALTRDAEHAVDLRLVKIIRGIPSIPPERVDVAGAKRHGDFAVALVLAYFASRMQWHEYDYLPAPKPHNRFDEAGESVFRRRAEDDDRLSSRKRDRRIF
ncbi:terminase large subunit domain-containing protein [Mesorhizobium sp. ES1-1]|uniref:terminase large subunit domain-containing protein n=1 Tax=Mesorhizobium sp. ES1-1 TaxID=2876629 RepID=UPI001CCAA24A|nr:terminase family protein [Mesorhizobium sp. ES1-1]MBZ9678907.1 terminase family protein [Mesorhizobium sp. ES1-1]